MLHEGGGGSIRRSTGFFVGSMTEFLDAEWPVEHRHPVGFQER
jgi:hypothetical protein